MTTTMTTKIIEVIMGVILVAYFVGATFNNIGNQMGALNQSISGAPIMILLPLMLAFGVVFLVYRAVSK